MQIVFVSCVSAQFRDLRVRLAAHSSAQYSMSIQRRFRDTASPYGTLVKIYEHLRTVDLVVHIIGAAPSALVSRGKFDELLRHDPSFRRWLSQNGLLASALAGRLGYGHVEAYLAIYFKMPLVPVFFQNGTQPEHVDRLRRMGRHVEKTISSMDNYRRLFPSPSRSKKSEVAERRAAHMRGIRSRTLLWAAALFALLSTSLVMHLSVTVLQARTPVPFVESVAFCCLGSCVRPDRSGCYVQRTDLRV